MSCFSDGLEEEISNHKDIKFKGIFTFSKVGVRWMVKCDFIIGLIMIKG